MGHIALWTSVIGFVLLSHQYNEVKVVPDVVLEFNVLLK